jgi:hypothetical protein
MAGSWRDILDGAAASSRIDAGRARRGQVQDRPGGRERHPSGRSHSGAQARDLLDLELQALSALTAGGQRGPADRREAIPQRKPPHPMPPAGQAVPMDGRYAAQPRRPRHTSLMAALNDVVRNPAAHFRRLPPEEPRPFPRERERPGSYSPLREVLAPAESKRSARPMPAKRLRSIILSKTFWQRSLPVFLLSVIVIGVAAHMLLHRSRQIGAATNARGDLIDVPLPSRRPATLRTQSDDSIFSRLFGDQGNAERP